MVTIPVWTIKQTNEKTGRNETNHARKLIRQKYGIPNLARNFSLDSQAYIGICIHPGYLHRWLHFGKACLLYMGLWKVEINMNIDII